MENCVEKINNRDGEDFKILYLKGGPKREHEHTVTEKPYTTHTRKSSTKEANNNKGKEKEQQQHISKTKEKKKTAQKENSPKDNEDIRKTSKSGRHNPYNLIQEKSSTGIGMMVGIFPGSNRQEQLAILAEIYGILPDSDLINIEHRNGNS